MKSSDIRKTFIDYFVKNGHTFVPSSATIPEDDPSLLFTNAGMNQFKNTFLGNEKRPYSRATNSQKCVRAGGKHNDLEAVGHTARHHTFFEMMGNFSFGDYFKKEAIHYAWDLLINEYGFDKNRLYVSVFETDDEAAEIWHKQENVPKERIFRFGEKDNFWRMGETGPCGPNSEIFYDHGDIPGEIADPYKNIVTGGDRFVEIWNLVFMQYSESAPGQMTSLPNPSIDTGAGLERLAAVLQGQPNNYDTDTFYNIINTAAGIAGIEYAQDPSARPKTPEFQEKLIALRVLADHARCAAFLIADGVLPANDGRGYVLRRILRRAIRYARNLSDDSLFPKVVEATVAEMGGFFQELEQRKSIIMTNVSDEETRFLSTLDTGTELLTEQLNKLEKKGEKTLSGDLVFKLYDTFGFPQDLTRIMANERGFNLDESGFDEKMQSAKKLARASWKGGTSDEVRTHLKTWSQNFPATDFVGYTQNQCTGKILALSDGKKELQKLDANQLGYVIFDKSPFYAESGGQAADNGHAGDCEIRDCQKYDKVFVHTIKTTSPIQSGNSLDLNIDSDDRGEIANHHSATHLMHSALRQVLGEHVSQAGSLVEKDRLRFDFTHSQPLKPEEIKQIENIVNKQIARSVTVESQVMIKERAIESGALALFGEKYDDEVRVIKMGDFSVELCGGTHVTNTSQIRLFCLVSETGVSSGVRRIEALTGQAALLFLQKHQFEHQQALSTAGAQQNWIQFLSDDKEKLNLSGWIEEKKREIKKLEKQIQSASSSRVDLDSAIAGALPFRDGGSRFANIQLEIEDRKVLSEIADKMRDKIQSGVVLISGKGQGSHPVLVVVTKDLSGTLNAGKILKSVAEILGGKGGGRADFAQGAASDLKKWPEAVAAAQSHLP